jgi:ECF transporter S component (folate family)
MTKTRQLTLDAMLAALCAVLGYVALDLGNIKITFESLPILLGALLLGPASGFAIGGVGTLIYQLLKYGVSVTTVLWMAPYMLCGLIVGWYAKGQNFELSSRRLMVLVVLNELLITVLNTVVMYVDSKIYGYYSFVYIFGSLGLRLVICLVKACVFGALLPALIDSIRRLLHKEAA